jgi:hypothetical protein
MKTNNFYACDSADSVQLRYDELCKIFSDHEPMLQALKTEYSTLMNVLGESKPSEIVKEKASLSEKIKELQEKVKQEGLKLEITGTWLWVSGKTYAVRDTLKSIGFRYSSQKQSWYFRDEESRSFNQTPLPMDQIRELYGSKEVALR